MSASSKSNAKNWFVLTKHGERGPYSTTALRRFAWQGNIRRVTQVRLEDGQWFEAGRVEGLWDIRWRRPNGELVQDGEEAAETARDPMLTAALNKICSLTRAATSWLTKPCMLAICSPSER